MHAVKSCPGSDHRPPAGGGTCPCGMVTRVPALPVRPRTDVRDLVARCLYDGPGDPLEERAGPRLEGGVPVLLRQRADRLLAALAAAGLEVAPGSAARRPAGVARC